MELFLAFGNGAEARVTFRPRSPSLGLDGQLHRVPPDRGGEGGREPRGNPFIFFVHMLTVSHTRMSQEILLSEI